MPSVKGGKLLKNPIQVWLRRRKIDAALKKLIDAVYLPIDAEKPHEHPVAYLEKSLAQDNLSPEARRSREELLQVLRDIRRRKQAKDHPNKK